MADLLVNAVVGAASPARLYSNSSAGGIAETPKPGPVISVFWHLDEYGEAEEWQVTFKTTTSRYAELEAHLLAEHPWDNPEVTATEITRGSPNYLTWLDRTTDS